MFSLLYGGSAQTSAASPLRGSAGLKPLYYDAFCWVGANIHLFTELRAVSQRGEHGALEHLHSTNNITAMTTFGGLSAFNNVSSVVSLVLYHYETINSCLFLF